MADSADTPVAVVVMGVSGSGKSTVARLLARELGAEFADADDLHPPANVAKMSAGIPLDDADREPWLERVGTVIAEHIGGSTGIVVACSALRRRYRDAIRRAAPGTRFVHLNGSPAVLAARMDARTDHFMPPSLLASQLATLEPLDPDEAGTVVDIDRPVAEIVSAAVAGLGAPEGEVFDTGAPGL